MERDQAEAGFHRVGEFPTEHETAEPIHDGDQVQKAAAHRDVSNIGALDVVRSLDRDAAQQVRIHFVTRRRAAELPAPIQMCDAQSRNVPKLAAGVQILLANCLAHGRRQLLEVAVNFPDECRYVLEMLGQVYGHDAEVRETGLTPDERLRFRQERSGPVMDQLHGWLEAQFAERRTEPNSGLGKAITYLLRHWRPLKTFLRVAGAPL